jgi:hypothetical protein
VIPRTLTVLALCAASSAGAQQGPRTATVGLTDAVIAIDGMLDESAWAEAPEIGELVQRQPRAGAVPTERTSVKMLHDGRTLYIAAVAYDSQPGRVIGTQMARDATLTSDDRIEILLDTFRDQRNAYYFSLNPAGAMVDGLVFADEELNTDWDSIWDARTARTDEGWVAEIAIPFKSLSFPQGATHWGFNFARTVQRKLEESRWSGARLETQFLQVSEGGLITNLDGANQGIGLDVRPFVAGRWLRFGDLDDDASKGEPGLDVFYNITPSLKLTGTINTDFGETEVDARQINLSRFSLLFPEKRAFFLEDAGVFAFGSTGPEPPGGIPPTGADVFPFFSRQIGLLAGEEVPIDAGLKLTGKAGRTHVGVLGVRTGETELTSEKDFVVGRVKHNILGQSHIGAIFTDGNPAADTSSRTYGADLRLATPRFLGGPRNFVLNAYGLRTENEGVDDDDWSYGFSARYPNDRFDAQVVLRDIQQNFEPELGFVQRDNVRMTRIAGSYNPRPRNFMGVQQMFHDVFYTRFERLDTGDLESWDLYVTPFDWHLNSGDAIHSVLDVNLLYERLFEPFEIAPGVLLPVGEYRFTRFKHNFASASKRRLSGSVSITWGDYWSGRAEQVTTALTYKLPPWFTVTLSTNQTFAHLPEGDFTARIFTSTLNYSASPFFSLANLVQYDNRSRNLGWQSRVRWTMRPGNDLFFAFQQGWIREDLDDVRFRTQDSKVSAKLQYTLRF